MDLVSNDMRMLKAWTPLKQMSLWLDLSDQLIVTIGVLKYDRRLNPLTQYYFKHIIIIKY